MQSKQYFTKIKNYPHEKSTEPKLGLFNPIIAFCHVDFALLHNNSYKHSLMPLLEINPL